MFAKAIYISLPISSKEDGLALKQYVNNGVELARRNRMPLNHNKAVRAAYTRGTSPYYYSYKIDGVVVGKKDLLPDLEISMN